ncbi:uncharacterized protein TA18195 [Theileria annulata]|uniref:Uncharacterized protein n=1 Tax=Theileria annulata TaxID=5874 RepID=Q4UB13_THEAN|nr:uncharacterized protein TA18195 [Theileria annulata]CAI75988.1 hypothetical protein TA18195 [Theileria annulata]|eukprot:XP_955464.1 hypothetical protein TA18195 [Theileria annulata]
MMEGANRGPYARVIPYNNGRYKRVVDPTVPNIIIKLSACCGLDSTQDFDLLVQNSFENHENLPTRNYTLEKFEKSSDYSTDFMSNLEDVNSLDESYENSDIEKVNGLQEEQLEEEDELEQQELEQEIELEQQLQFEEQELKETQKLEEEQKLDEEMNVKSMELKELESKGSGTVKWEDEEGDFENYFKKVPEDEGVPILFYTKTRDKPAFLMLTIDFEMEVIYMSRNKVSRFFPIKLIGKLITDQEVIMKEFSRQIMRDKNIKLQNMVLFNASNFTDSVAIQFADETTKESFITEVSKIKDLINNRH